MKKISIIFFLSFLFATPCFCLASVSGSFGSGATYSSSGYQIQVSNPSSGEDVYLEDDPGTEIFFTWPGDGSQSGTYQDLSTFTSPSGVFQLVENGSGELVAPIYVCPYTPDLEMSLASCPSPPPPSGLPGIPSAPTPFYYSPMTTLLAGIYLHLIFVFATFVIIWFCAKILIKPIRAIWKRPR